MATAAQRTTHEKWLLDISSLPTAAGREHRVIQYIADWTAKRSNLKLTRDKAGNLFIRQTAKNGNRRKPLLITAHLDHPAFVVSKVHDERTIDLEFRGGVQDPYFQDALIDIIDDNDQPHLAAITHFNGQTKPFKQVTVRLRTATDEIAPGDVGRWYFGEDSQRQSTIVDGMLHAPACDDLAAVAAALATLDIVRKRKGLEHVGVLFTLAEEVGFIGAIAACKHKAVPKSARLICLENSRSFPESPIGGGPILRVGDRISVFAPELTNRISDIMLEHEKKQPDFKWQRKLMPGGACEATTFSTYGYESTCICLPLGNYHNMIDIDGVRDGKRPAQLGPEYISIEDYHGMIDMLVLCAQHLDTLKTPDLRKRMEKLFADKGHVLDG
jgi:putative aminopeptidase FrvX